MARPVQPEKITFPPFNIIKGESGLRRIPPKPKREHTATGADHPNQARIPRGSPADPPRIPLGSLHFSSRNYELQSILRALRAPPRGAVGMQISSGSPVHAQWCLSGSPCYRRAHLRFSSSFDFPVPHPHVRHSRGLVRSVDPLLFDPDGLCFLAQWRPKAPQRIPS